MILINTGFAVARDCVSPTGRVFLMFYMTDIVILLHLFYQFYKKSYRRPKVPKVTIDNGAASAAATAAAVSGDGVNNLKSD